MAALVYASRMPDSQFEIAVVGSNDENAKGLAFARAEGIPTFAHPHRGVPRAEHDAAMAKALVESGADYVALAGYMRIIGPEFVDRFAGKMFNIHPSLLPKYKGLHTHKRAIEAGDSHAGCSVHLVSAELDSGPMLGQTPVAIHADDDEHTLAARVLIAEHQLYSRCINAYLAQHNPV